MEVGLEVISENYGIGRKVPAITIYTNVMLCVRPSMWVTAMHVQGFMVMTESFTWVYLYFCVQVLLLLLGASQVR